jgi:hypothetical protein
MAGIPDSLLLVMLQWTIIPGGLLVIWAGLITLFSWCAKRTYWAAEDAIACWQWHKAGRPNVATLDGLYTILPPDAKAPAAGSGRHGPSARPMHRLQIEQVPLQTAGGGHPSLDTTGFRATAASSMTGTGPEARAGTSPASSSRPADRENPKPAGPVQSAGPGRR